MDSKFEIKSFGDIKIRTKWDSEIEDHYFSVVDVIEVLIKLPRLVEAVVV